MKRILLRMILPMLAGFVVASLVMAACAETTVLNVFGPSDDGLVANVDQALVRECRLAPSSVKMINGAELRMQVRTFAAGGVEVVVWPVSAAIEGEQIVQILAAAPSSNANRELILKARGVGETTLVVIVGSARCSAPITVTQASP